MWIGEAERLHRSVPKCFRAALGHHFDRQAAIKIRCRSLPLMKTGFVGGTQGRDESLVLLARKGAVDVVGSRPTRASLVVTRLKPRLIEVDAVAMDYGCDCVDKCQLLFAGQSADFHCQTRRREWAGGDDNAVPVVRG